jgi:hypothetical protein
VDFYERFEKSLEASDINKWNKHRVIKSLPQQFPYGIHSGNKRCIGNLSFEQREPEPNAKPVVLFNGRLVAKRD